MNKHFFYFKNIWQLYDQKMQSIFWLIIFLIFISAFGEFFAIISIKPLISKVINNNIDSKFINLIFFRIESKNTLFLSFTLIISLFTALSLKVLNLWFITKFSAKTGTIIATKIYSENILTKYFNYNKQESSYITSALTNQLGTTVTGFINVFKLFSSIIVCLFIFYGLLLNNFLLNSLATLLFLSIYLLSYFLVKDKLKQNSRIIKSKSESNLMIIKDGFGGNKEIIANNLQNYFKKSYINSDWPARKAIANNYVLKIIPRSVIEFISFSIIILLSIISINNRNNSGSLISYIGTLAFAIQRFMPQLQTIFASWTYLKGQSASINNILNLVKNIKIKDIYPNTNEALNFKKVELKNINFSYEKNNKKNILEVLKDLNITIRCGERIAILGESGSGKSTLIDIIMGLIKPDSGYLKIDNIDIHKDNNEAYLYKWRNTFSVLTQNPYFINGTILENITFGDIKKNTDINKVIESTKKAKIYEYINKLPKKFETNIGEMGSKISGGQAQRIALARAFYSNKKFLILDEATSALDEYNQKEIVKSLKELDSNMTLLVITHRKTLLEICTRSIVI